MSIVSNIVKPIVSSIVKPISRGDILRNIISFDGINQYGTLATPWAPGGQGRITMHVKVVDSAIERYLFDGEDSGLNRLFAYIDSADNVIASAGLTAVVGSSGIAFAADSTVQQAVITGDMTGLTVGRILSKYDNTGFSDSSILYAKFEDLSVPDGSNDLEFDFSSGVGYELPVGDALGSELVTNGAFDDGVNGWTPQNGSVTIAVVDGELEVSTAAGFLDAYQDLTLIPGSSYFISGQAKAGTSPALAEIRVDGLSSGNSGIITSGTLTDFSFDFVAGSTNSINLQVQAASGIAYFDNISIKEIPTNLINYKNYSADQWGRYRQLLNGNWERIVSPFDIIVVSDYLKGL